MQAGEPTVAEREALARWLAADPRHGQAYAELEALWAQSAQLLLPQVPAVQAPAGRAELERQAGQAEQARAARAGHPGLSRRRFVGLGAAAGTAAVAVGSAGLWLKGIGSPFADRRTAVGERRVEPLPDGSTVELAGNSALNLDFSSGRRSVELLQGEAFFTVAPSTAASFTVNTQAGQVFASEGAFCLSCEGPAATLSVSRHTARVSSNGQQVDLAEGLALRFSALHVGRVEHVDVDQVLAWREGRLVFFDKPLSAVVNEMQRWREGRIFIADERLAARRVSLILNLNQPDQMLEVLGKALGVKMRRYTDWVTVLSVG